MSVKKFKFIAEEYILRKMRCYEESAITKANLFELVYK